MKLQAFQAAQTYALNKSALRADAPNKPATDPAQSASPSDNFAFETVHALTKSVAQSEQAAMNLMSRGADPHSVVEAIATAELAVETAVTVRDKVVEAYQELIRMPI